MMKRIEFVQLILGVALSLALTPFIAQAENWPRFRGPTGQGIATETGLPLEWGPGKNIAWQAEVPGEGWSSPIVWNDRIYITYTTDNGVACHVMCIDGHDGKVVWDTEVFKEKPTRKEGQNSYATPTAVIDGQRVYAFFGSGGAAALTLDGKVAWTNTNHPHYSRHGFGSSPVLFKDLLIMSYDVSDPTNEPLGWVIPWDKSYVLALDKNTGKERWQTPHGMTRQAHQAAQIETIDGKQELIIGAGDVVHGFEPETGKLIWWFKNPGEGVVPSPVFGDGMVFVSSGFPTPVGKERTYAAIRAVKLGGVGDITKDLVWEEKRFVPMIASFAFTQDMLFTIKEDGMAQCLDARTGKNIWKQRMAGEYASPVVAEGRVYFLSNEGVTTVIDAGREFKQLAENALPVHETTQASMAVSNGRFYIRTKQHLFCIAGGK